MSTEKDREDQPEWVRSALKASEGLGALTQVKGGWTCWCGQPFRCCDHAGHTCEKCPNPFRPRERCICEPLEPPEGYPHGWDEGAVPEGDCRTYHMDMLSASITPSRGCGLPLQFTKRCRKCNTRMARWTDGREMARRARLAQGTIPEAKRVAWVTMTVPNYPASVGKADAVRAVKAEVAKWRRSTGIELHVLGGVDYFEVTVNPEDGSINAHMHGLWVMSGFWKQSDMLASWGRGGARIEDLTGRESKAADYCTAYGSKAPVAGVRCKETWGVCRGVQWAAVEVASGRDAKSC
ncbi:MAG TPA: hypothetical protein EYN66_16910 [Myxococcales bacterium]|nr:hypothetical protein [Myxococcales bacterium]